MTQEALKLALDLATMHHTDAGYAALRAKVRSASKEALAQPEQKPVAWICHGADGKHDIDFYQDEIDAIPVATMLYTTPSQRKPLTDEQIGQAARDAHIAFCLNKHQTYEHAITRAIEAAHGIKENT